MSTILRGLLSCLLIVTLIGLANIKAKGVNVLVLSDSLVQFDPAAVKLEHGRVNVVTTRGLAVRVGVLKVVPASDSASTEFEVTDYGRNGKDHRAQRRSEAGRGKTTTTLPEGQEASRDEESRKRGAGIIPAATGSILNSPVAITIGGGAISGLLVWVLL